MSTNNSKHNNFTIVTFNVRGLQSYEKQQIFRTWIHTNKPHVILLQETHTDQDLINILKLSYPNSWWSIDPSNSLGVGIIVLRPDITISNVIIDPSCQYIACTAKLLNTSFSILNIYAPTKSQERVQWFPELLALQFDHPLILAGDFNFTTKPIHRNKPNGSTSGSIQLKHFTNKWFLKEPEATNPFYSWINLRLDRFYISTAVTYPSIYYEPFHSIGLSDHHPITLNLEKTKPGKGYWKFNNAIYHSKEHNKIN